MKKQKGRHVLGISIRQSSAFQNSSGSDGLPHHKAHKIRLARWILHHDKKERKENYASSKKAPHINKGKGATWEEKPLHQKRKGRSVRIRRVVSRQLVCLSQQTSPDKFEGEQIAQENVWSTQAYEHSAQNEHEA